MLVSSLKKYSVLYYCWMYDRLPYISVVSFAKDAQCKSTLRWHKQGVLLVVEMMIRRISPFRHEKGLLSAFLVTRRFAQLQYFSLKLFRNTWCPAGEAVRRTQPPPQFLNQVKLLSFQQTHNQGLCQLFLRVCWELRAHRATPDCVFVSPKITKATEQHWSLKGHFVS